MKFYIDSDGDINVEYDFPVHSSDECIGEMAFEIFVRTMQILDGEYEFLMKTLYTEDEIDVHEPSLPSGFRELLEGLRGDPELLSELRSLPDGLEEDEPDEDGEEGEDPENEGAEDFGSAFLTAMMGMHGDNDGQYKEIRKLDYLLAQANIPHAFLNHMTGGFQITYYGAKGKPEAKPGVFMGPGVGAVCSAIETPFSYGHENDRIEISGLLTEEEYSSGNSALGNLTAEDVFDRIKAHWEKENQA